MDWACTHWKLDKEKLNMALSQSDLDRLEKALAKGTLSVEVDGDRVAYRSIGELKEAIAYVSDQLARRSASGSTSVSFASHTRC